MTLLILCLAAQLQPSPRPEPSAYMAPTPRMEKLVAWLHAMERHRLRAVDDDLLRIAAWSGDDLERLALDVRTLVTIVRNPQGTTFYRDAEENPRNLRQRLRTAVVSPYTSQELTAFRGIAFDLRRRTDGNGLLFRGALFHSDIAMWLPYGGTMQTPTSVTGQPRTPTTSAGAGRGDDAPAAARAGAAPRGPSRPGAGPAQANAPQTSTTFLFEDGRSMGFSRGADHWLLARRLLNAITVRPPPYDVPAPGKHPLVQLWYHATLAHMQQTEYLVRGQLDRALELFPRAGGILSLGGSFHATLADPRFQFAVRSTGTAAALGVESAGGELRLAEDLFERAVDADGDDVEARLRYGRVLGLLGRADAALKQLTVARAKATTSDRLAQYYAAIFFAREAAVLGDVRQAREAYDQAAALYPLAQTPRFGLSQLASRTGDRVAALATLREVLGTSMSAPAERDPIWMYQAAAGRHALPLLDELYAKFSGRLGFDPYRAP